MDPVALKEKEKYQRLAKLKAYQGTAGFRQVPRAIAQLSMQGGESLIDFGCGTGKAARAMQDMGMKVVGVDITSDRLTADIPFVEATLWDLPQDMDSADWGFCTDVMEHLPEDQVIASLLLMREKVRRGIYFSISTRPDRCGALIGEVLHLTVWPAQTWLFILERFWKVDHVKIRKDAFHCCCWVKDG